MFILLHNSRSKKKITLSNLTRCKQGCTLNKLKKRSLSQNKEMSVKFSFLKIKREAFEMCLLRLPPGNGPCILFLSKRYQEKETSITEIR